MRGECRKAYIGAPAGRRGGGRRHEGEAHSSAAAATTVKAVQLGAAVAVICAFNVVGDERKIPREAAIPTGVVVHVSGRSFHPSVSRKAVRIKTR
jgi:hypothetical protein